MLLKRIRKTVSAIAKIALNPWLLNHVLADDGLWKEYVEKKYKRSQLPMIDIESLFPLFKEELPACTFLDGGSSPMDLALLRSLCRLYKGCSYFEIGTWRGESVANVADVCGFCYTLDLPPDKHKKNLSHYGILSKDISNVTHLYGDSRTYNFEGLNKKFDVIFIDGDHHFDFVISDTEKIFQHLFRGDSTVVWHDYGYDPINIRYEVLAAILDGVPEKFHKNLYHVSNTMSAVYLNRNIDTKDSSENNQAGNGFSVTIQANK